MNESELGACINCPRLQPYLRNIERLEKVRERIIKTAMSEEFRQHSYNVASRTVEWDFDDNTGLDPDSVHSFLLQREGAKLERSDTAIEKDTSSIADFRRTCHQPIEIDIVRRGHPTIELRCTSLRA